MYILHVLTEDIIFIEDIFVLLLQELSSWPGRRAAAGALCSHPALIGTAFVKSNAFLK